MPKAAVIRHRWHGEALAAAALLVVLLLLPCLAGAGAVLAAVRSDAMEKVLAAAQSNEQVSAILYLGSRVTMDELYPVARSLPMSERRAYVVRTLKARFAEMSSDLLPQLDGARRNGEVTHVRPLWVLNAVRITASAHYFSSLDAAAPAVEYVDADRPHPNTLDQEGWGVRDMQAERVWGQLGVDGSGVVVGHLDAGTDLSHPGLIGHFWLNPGEDLNGNGALDAEETNGVDDDGNGYVDDFFGWDFDRDNNDVNDEGGGHGTKSGSVISSSFGITGCDTISVAPGAKLMELSAFILQGAYFEASQYAIMMGAQVISSSVSFKSDDCDDADRLDCPNFVAHRRVAEIELAAGLIHANSTGNVAGAIQPPLSLPAPSNCPPPALTAMHPVHGGVSSIVSVTDYTMSGFHSFGGIGPAGWSRQDLCYHPRMPFCGPAGSGNEYPAEYDDYPYMNGTSPGLTKPDIAGPGTSVPLFSVSGGCTSGSGTSFATPHIGGALALICSAFPGITPEDAYLLLISTARDLGDTGFDNIFGFGKPQLFTACSTGVTQRGAVHGAVTTGGQPLAGVRISTDSTNSITTGPTGLYALSLPPGTYVVRYEKYGYQTVGQLLNVDAGQVLTQDVAMVTALTGIVSGIVATSNGDPIGGVPVSIPGTPLETVTDTDGAYQLTVYAGHYTLVAGALPWETRAVDLVVSSGAQTANVALARSPRAQRTGPDEYGYYIYDNFDTDTAAFNWVEINPGQDGLPGQSLAVGDEGITSRTLPFTFRFYGQDYNSISVGANGLIVLGNSGFTGWDIAPIPSTLPPDGYLAVFRSDWQTQFGSVWFYADEINGRAIVEWYDVPNYFGSTRATFQAILYDPAAYPTPTDDGPIKFQYQMMDRPFDGTIGIEDPTGQNGLQYGYQQQYEDHAAPIGTGRALYITTDSTFGPSAVEPVARPTLPAVFALAQNYPNPFNPTTTFAWTVARTADMRLTLYDVLGREAAVVFEGQQAPGEYRADFNGAHLATGIYFARLEANGQAIAVRKVMLLK